MEEKIIEILNVSEHNLFILIENNLLYFTIIFAAIIGKIKESSKQNILSVWLIYLIGTFFTRKFYNKYCISRLLSLLTINNMSYCNKINLNNNFMLKFK